MFQNFFPNKNVLNSIISSHYSPKSKKFYFFTGFLKLKKNFRLKFNQNFIFFTDKFYLEYENENKFVKKDIIRNLSSKLTNVIQNHEDYDSVYLVDSNKFVYYLNLNNDYLESVDRRTASLKLFTNCIHEK